MIDVINTIPYISVKFLADVGFTIKKFLNYTKLSRMNTVTLCTIILL